MTSVQAAPPVETTGRTERAARTRRAIHDAGARCFGRRGYAQTSMDEIAAAAGVAKPTVYAHAGSKSDLFTTLLRSTLDELDEAHLVEVARPDEVGPALTDYALGRIDRLLDDVTLGLLRAAALVVFSFLIFCGGLARLSSGQLDLLLGADILAPLIAELVLAPLLAWWVWRATARPSVD